MSFDDYLPQSIKNKFPVELSNLIQKYVPCEFKTNHGTSCSEEYQYQERDKNNYCHKYCREHVHMWLTRLLDLPKSYTVLYEEEEINFPLGNNDISIGELRLNMSYLQNKDHKPISIYFDGNNLKIVHSRKAHLDQLAKKYNLQVKDYYLELENASVEDLLKFLELFMEDIKSSNTLRILVNYNFKNINSDFKNILDNLDRKMMNDEFGDNDINQILKVKIPGKFKYSAFKESFYFKNKLSLLYIINLNKKY